jgi:RND family efflux transporter MFP subunit
MKQHFALMRHSLLGLSLVLAAVLLWLSTPALTAPSGTARPALTVSVTKPSLIALPSTIRANGNIAAWQDASVGAQVGGLRIAEVRVNVGDHVKKGQVLAVFAQDNVLADLAVQKAQESEAVAALAEAEANASRARSLKTSGALSAQQISQYLTAQQTAAARVEAARAHRQSQELRLKYTEVLAPDDGVISARMASVGAVVPVGAELFKMLRQNRLEWRAEVVSEELGRIKVGMPVDVFPASLAKGQPPVIGKVRVIGPTVDPQARTAIVYVDLPIAQSDETPIRAGMFASGTFNLGDRQGLTLPQESVVMRDGFSYVFKLGTDQRVEQVRIQTGRRVDVRVEVLSGLSAADTIVESGAGFLTHGDLVSVNRP